MRGSVFTCPSGGTATSITAYIFDDAGADKQAAIYKHSDSTLLANGTTNIDESAVNPAAWRTFTFSTPPTLEADTYYVLVVRGTDPALVYYDEGQQDQGHYEDGGLGSFPSTASFTHSGDNIFSIYCTYTIVIPPVYPTQPVLYSPENSSTTADNTPRFEWTNGENADNHRLEVDNDPDFSSVEENTVVPADDFYTIASALSPDNYWWRIAATNENGDNLAAAWTFQLYPAPSIVTDNSADVTYTSATLNATISYNGFPESVGARFNYTESGAAWFAWDRSDHQYTAPTDPATAGNWGGRTPVRYVAASDSSAADNAAADYLCDGSADDNQINQAIDNVAAAGSGKVVLFAGHYKIWGQYMEENSIYIDSNNITLVGAGRDNTFIERENAETQVMALIGVTASNILIENLTIQGLGQQFDTEERNGIHPMSGENIVIRNVTVRNFVSIGIYLELRGSVFSNMWVDNCIVENAGNNGITVGPLEVGDRLIENVYILNNIIIRGGSGSPGYPGGGFGIFTGNLRHSVIANNTIENAGERGIGVSAWYNISTPENVLIQGNRISNSGALASGISGGIMVAGSSQNIAHDITIRGNRVYDNLNGDMDDGIEFYNYVENCTIDNNWLGTLVSIVENTGIGHVIENNLIGRLLTWENTGATAYTDNIANLSFGTQYTYRGELRFDGLVDNGNTLTFTTLSGPPPTKPVLYLPADGSTINDNTPYFEWTNAEGVENHRLEVDNDPDFSSLTLNWEVPPGTLTHTFYSENGDGSIYLENASYGMAHDPSSGTVENTLDSLYIGQIFSDSTYRVNRGFIYFDTSPLENLTIASAELAIYGDTDASYTNFEIVLQNGGDNDPPLTATDFDYTLYDGYGVIPFNTTDFMTYDYTYLTLNSEGLSWINKAGTTKFVLRSSMDIDNTAPTEEEYVTIFSSEKGGSYRPRLRVTIADNAYTSENVLIDDNYSWRVAAINENGENTSTTWTFILSTAANVGPNSPTDLEIGGETNPTRVTGLWDVWVTGYPFGATVTDNNDGDTITHYHIQVDNDNDFSSPRGDTGQRSLDYSIPEGESTIMSAEWLENEATQGTTWYWRVRFWDSDGAEGQWSSETATFKRNQLPDPPTGWTNLGTRLTDHTPTINWTKGTDNDGDNVTTYVYVHWTPNPGAFENSTLDNQTILGQTLLLHDGVVYYYRLRSFDNDEFSSYTADDDFMLNTPPSVSPTIFPSTPISEDNLTCEPNGLDADGDDMTYTYQWQENWSPILLQTSNTLNNSYTESGNRYSCVVAASDGYENSSLVYSNEVTVRGANIPPVTSSPLCQGEIDPTDVSSIHPLFTWVYADADGDVQSHWQIYVGTDNGLSDMWDSGVQAGAYTSDVYGGAILENDTTYHWRVRTRDGRNWSGWVTGVFTTLFITTPTPEEPELTAGEYFFVPAKEDATVLEHLPDDQFGFDTRLYCGLVVGRKYSYIKFDITAIENYEYIKIQLSLVADNSTNVPVVEVWRGTNDWSEPNITWNTRSLVIQQVGVMDWSDGDDLEIYRTYYADVTSAVDDALDQGQDDITFVLIPQGSPVGQEAVFLSREAGEFHTLEVLYTPETPLIPAVAVAFMFTISLLGIFTWLYVKIRDVKDFSTGAWAIACAFISLLAIIISWGISSAFL